MPSQKTLPKMVLQKKSKKCTKKKEKWHYCLRQPLRSEIGKEGGQKISSFGAQQIFPFQPVTYFTIIMRHEKNPRILCICLMWRLLFLAPSTTTSSGKPDQPQTAGYTSHGRSASRQKSREKSRPETQHHFHRASDDLRNRIGQSKTSNIQSRHLASRDKDGQSKGDNQQVTGFLVMLLTRSYPSTMVPSLVSLFFLGLMTWSTLSTITFIQGWCAFMLSSGCMIHFSCVMGPTYPGQFAHSKV